MTLRAFAGGAARRSLAVALLAAAAVPLRAQSTCPPAQVPAPTLVARARLDTVRAAYVLMVDESQSMTPLWPAVRSALATFAQAIPNGDELRVQLFSTDVRGLISPVPANDAVRAGWVRTFEALPAPKGAHTDLGVAADNVLKELAAAPPSRQTFVFFLTDGQHDPGTGSSYPRDGSGGWTDLTKRAHTLISARPIDVAILRLAPTADQTLLPSVFKGATVDPVLSAPQLSGWFCGKARQVAVDKLKLLIRDELRRPAFVVAPRDPLTLGTVTASSNAAVAHANRSIVTTVLDAPASGVLPDGSALRVSDGVRDGSTVSVAARAASHPWYLPPLRGTDSATASLTTSAHLEPANELRMIGLAPETRPDSVSVRGAVAGASLAAVAGYYLLAALSTGLVLSLVLLARWSMHRPALRGQLTIDRGRAGDETVQLGDGRTTYAVPGRSGAPLVTFQARAKRGRTVVYAIPAQGTPLTWRGRTIYAPVVVSGTGSLEHEDATVHYYLR